MLFSSAILLNVHVIDSNQSSIFSGFILKCNIFALTWRIVGDTSVNARLHFFFFLELLSIIFQSTCLHAHLKSVHFHRHSALTSKQVDSNENMLDLNDTEVSIVKQHFRLRCDLHS